MKQRIKFQHLVINRNINPLKLTGIKERKENVGHSPTPTKTKIKITLKSLTCRHADLGLM